MTANRSLNCLTCQTTLEQRQEHGVTVDYCPECGGVWLDPGELEALTGHSSHGHSHERDIDVDFEGDEEEQEEEEGGILSTIAGALGGEEGEFEEEEEFEIEGGFEEEEEF